MSALPLLTVSLLVSSLMCLIANSWVSIWIFLELNTLSFCSMMKTYSKEKYHESEMAMKYFVIQSIPSSVLLFSSVSTKIKKELSLFFALAMMISILVKMAAVPFQQWFIVITSNCKWKNSTTLMTWQKLAPVFLVTYQMKNFVWPFLIFTSAIGALSQMNKKLLLEIMAYSSVFNLSWMLMSITLSMKAFVAFSMIYWVSVVLMMYMIEVSNMKSISLSDTNKMKKWIVLMILLNLGGIPPMAGFLAKWMVFYEGVHTSSITLVTVLLTTSSINLYIYMRAVNKNMTKNPSSQQKSMNSNKKNSATIMVLGNFFPLAMLHY